MSRPDAALARLAATRDDQLARLDALLRIPSISADPERRGDVHAAAEWVRDELLALGMERADVRPSNGQPAVMGEWLSAGPDRPTVLVYAHFDVQPVDPLGLWTAPPFEPSIRDGRIYARGASDDKGQLMIHLAALRALFEADGRLPLNIRVFVEGEEEVGSPSLEAFLDANRPDLVADLAVVSDGSMFAEGVPSVGYGVRGLVYLEVTVRGPRQDLHSGIYGGGAPNPIHALARMLASLHEPAGRVAVPGFYDRVRPISDEERRRLAGLDFDESAYRAQVGAPDLAGELGFPLVERLWTRPTLDVNGIDGGFAGEGAKTIIPALARAKLSARLVPDQDPLDIAGLIEAALRAAAPSSVAVEVRVLGRAPAALVALDHPAVGIAAEALEATWDRPPVYQRGGGTIPAVGGLSDRLGLPTLMLGFGLPTSNAHAPDEWLLLDNFVRGTEAVVRLWHRLGAG
ncbi:MAG: dipeptidase [Chloroflexi bacterium]|nr:dipeptidase [Chloroflexota bacterium]